MSVVLITINSVYAEENEGYGFKNGQFLELNGYVFRIVDAETNYLMLHKALENRVFDLSNSNVYDPLNTKNVAYYLNTTFLNNLSDYSPHIKFVEWGPAKKIAKIGLISRKEWNTYGGKSFPKFENFDYWTLTPASDYNGTKRVYKIYYAGATPQTVAGSKIAVRPTLYLENNENLEIVQGTGTITNPYVLEIKPLKDISELSLLKTTETEITITWINPTEPNFQKIKIMLNGEIIESDLKDNKYTFKNLKPNTEYKILVIANYVGDIDTKGIEMVVSTNDYPIIPEVNNIKASTGYDRVKLTWSRVTNDHFSHVNIYRKKLNETNLIQKTLGEVYANEGYTPLFETNGTYFNDLTVSPETTYEYLLTTENVAGVESNGVTVQVTTLPEPPPQMGGIDFEEKENGDYLYKWTSPTKGQVKIIVGGNEFAIVAASIKQITIPKSAMKYTAMGNPDVRLIPISESGKEGKPINPNIPFSGIQSPIKVSDLLTTSIVFLWLLGPFILLVLAIVYAKKIIQLIRKSVENKKNNRVIR